MLELDLGLKLGPGLGLEAYLHCLHHVFERPLVAGVIPDSMTNLCSNLQLLFRLVYAKFNV